MAAYVQDGLDVGMPEPRCDDGWVGAFGDEEGNVAVSEVMEVHRLVNRVRSGGEPDAAAEGVAPDGAALGGR